MRIKDGNNFRFSINDISINFKSKEDWLIFLNNKKVQNYIIKPYYGNRMILKNQFIFNRFKNHWTKMYDNRKYFFVQSKSINLNDIEYIMKNINLNFVVYYTNYVIYFKYDIYSMYFNNESNCFMANYNSSKWNEKIFEINKILKENKTLAFDQFNNLANYANNDNIFDVEIHTI